MSKSPLIAKIFNEQTSAELEGKLNAFFSQHPDIELKKINYSVAGGEHENNHCVLLVYREKPRN